MATDNGELNFFNSEEKCYTEDSAYLCNGTCIYSPICN